MRREGYPVRDEDVARLLPFIHEKRINLIGRYSFAIHEAITRDEFWPLRNSDEDAYNWVIRFIAP